MSLVKICLDSAEDTWRGTIKTEFPLFLDTPVVKADPDPKNKRHWQFYTTPLTNSRGEKQWTTHMQVFKPAEVEKVFRDTIVPMYESAYGRPVTDTQALLSRLVHDNFAYLYFHEQFHPTFCPDSKNDQKLFDKALYDGIKAGCPGISKPQVLQKVGNVRNAGWDQVIDGAFYQLTNYRNSLEDRLKVVLPQANIALPQFGQLADGVVPIFDIIEFEKNPKAFDSMFYPLSRAIYGLMFTKEAAMRKNVFTYFKDRICRQMRPQEFQQAITSALRGVVSELDKDQRDFARLDKTQFERDVLDLYQHYDDPAYDHVHERVVTAINDLFLDKRTRYDAMRGFVKPLAKYISLRQEEKRHGTHINNQPGQGDPQPGQGQPGEGQGQGQPQPGQGQDGKPGDQQTAGDQPGGNTEQALLNLADMLGEGEGNQLLSQMANGGQTGGPAQAQKKLTALASDQFYKRNVPEINFRSPDLEAVELSMGKRLVPEYQTTIYVEAANVANLPLDQIHQFQEETGITQLFQLSEFQFQYDIYDWVEVEETDYTYKNTGLQVPRNVVFHVDSSGSMGSAMYVGTGSQYDTLMHVCYGTLKALLKGSEEMQEPVNVIAANFSNGTLVSDAIDLRHMYDTPNNSAKRVLTGFQGGGTEYSPSAMRKVRSMLEDGPTVHIFATDGGIFNADAAYSVIEQEMRHPDTTLLYFEIGCASSFGHRINQLAQQRPKVQYFPNTTIKQVQDKSLEILLDYD